MTWLTDATNWLREQWLAMWAAFLSFMKDLLLLFWEKAFDVFATMIEAMPVPDFLAQYSMGALLSNAGPTFAWLFGSLRIGEGLAMIGLGYAFRITRKLLTLGQW